jgi:uncharacterized protein
MDNRINKIVDKYIQVLIERQFGIEKAYLFGSYAKDNWQDDSDIDIAVIYNSKNNYDRFDLQVQLLIIANSIDTRIEPHPISNSDFNISNPFAYEIMQTGIKLKTVNTKK